MMRFYRADEISKLIQYLIEDDEMLVDHDFELRHPLRVRHIKQINKQLENNGCGFRIISCKHSIPYGECSTYKTPYFVYTRNVEPEAYVPPFNIKEYYGNN